MHKQWALSLGGMMQVYRHCQAGYWRASKRWCKKLPQDAVSKALIRFASNEAGLGPACVYGGPDGAIEQLKRLEKWFQVCNLVVSLHIIQGGIYPVNCSQSCLPSSKPQLREIRVLHNVVLVIDRSIRF